MRYFCSLPSVAEFLVVSIRYLCHLISRGFRSLPLSLNFARFLFVTFCHLISKGFCSSPSVSHVREVSVLCIPSLIPCAFCPLPSATSFARLLFATDTEVPEVSARYLLSLHFMRYPFVTIRPSISGGFCSLPSVA